MTGEITEDKRRSMSAGNGGQLNPQFVEWLMGYPPNWSNIGANITYYMRDDCQKRNRNVLFRQIKTLI